MYMPSIFGESLFDNMFPFDEKFFTEKKDPLYGKNVSRLMKTDVRETEKTYELDIDLPGFKKDEIQIELKDGYLTVTATAKKAEENTSDKKEKYVQKERFHATCNRSFYVGDAITEEDVHAKYEDGILKLSVPKKEAKAVEQTKHIAIEG